MSTPAGSTPSLTPSRSPTPEPPLQPDHFYGNESVQLPPSPDSDGKAWLDPDDDPLAQHGIPVFKPSLEEFQDFEAYMNRVECWGMKSGIVKIIPPKEWTDALPSIVPQLGKVKLKNPIEQHMLGRGGLFRQENLEKRRILSIREWTELCAKEDLRKDQEGRKKTRESETAEPDLEAQEIVIKEEQGEVDDLAGSHNDLQAFVSPPNSDRALTTPAPVTEHGVEVEAVEGDHSSNLQASASESHSVFQTPAAEDQHQETKPEDDIDDMKPKSKGRRTAQTREAREASLAERALKDEAFLETFDPHSDWLPSNTTPFDYTTEFCRELERRYWRNCGLGKPAWYGADLQGSLFTPETKSWNVATLKSALTRLLPASAQGLPGVNTPYLYFGMWRATFAWHVEDMDLFSINYIHFGAPKYWYAVPQARAGALENNHARLFPEGRQVLLTVPSAQVISRLADSSLPVVMSSEYISSASGRVRDYVSQGYHAGFNLGFNCAESVNFALESWLDLGRRAKACDCVNFSVRIDVDQLLRDRETERLQAKSGRPRSRKVQELDQDGKPISRKRKSEAGTEAKPKKPKIQGTSNMAVAGSSKSPTKITLKLGPKPKEPETFPCCLCVSASQEGLLRVHDPPLWRMDTEDVTNSASQDTILMAHEECANVVPETWVDEVDVGDMRDNGTRAKERVVFGVDGIVKDRWNLKCTACTKNRHRAHGAPIQCTKGKCPKAFHVSCARDGSRSGIVYHVLREVEKEVVLLDAQGVLPASNEFDDMAVNPNGVPQENIMDVDHAVHVVGAPDTVHAQSPGPRVLKLIRKLEVQVLCMQHNPAIAEAKKVLKQEKIRRDLLALPPMTRIKLRVSAGVFEVSLLRVIEESKSVEVLWDRGVRREFKWGSVVFGNTEGVTVGQKPTELAPENEQSVSATPSSHSRLPLLPTPAPPANSHVQHQLGSSSLMRIPTPSSSAPPPISPRIPAHQPYQSPMYQPHTSTYQYAPGAWTYQYSASNPQPHYNHAGPSLPNYQYSNPPRPGYPAYAPYSGYNYNSNQYTARELQWQRPYTGPRDTIDNNSSSVPGAVPQTNPYYHYSQSQTQVHLSNPIASSQPAGEPPIPLTPTIGTSQQDAGTMLLPS
ncbi:Lysine-specific demethylase 4D [Grifola frondosa]|uniref:[histone H3]-trimethyl-L-lysine(9) demethylase n=1 Tax=Grifola frondosa TaxID=5627 RepID=A0A1C7M8L1_GRIFR|nr:Lysine-specific demethylase 4D [Grifola frondosa]